MEAYNFFVIVLVILLPLFPNCNTLHGASVRKIRYEVEYCYACHICKCFSCNSLKTSPIRTQQVPFIYYKHQIINKKRLS